jgi:hypothetical protein
LYLYSRGSSLEAPWQIISELQQEWVRCSSTNEWST